MSELTVKFEQTEGREGIYTVIYEGKVYYDNKKYSSLADVGYAPLWQLSRLLTNTTGESFYHGIFSSGEQDFGRRHSHTEISRVTVVFDKDWTDAVNPAAEIKERVNKVKQAFANKYPVTTSSWTVTLED